MKLPERTIFERELAGEVISLDDPDYPQIYAVIRKAIRITSELNAMLVESNEQVNRVFSELINKPVTLLDIQFPVTTQLHEPILKNAQEYADRLAVHVNHLNRSVKDVTGKSTTTHLAERFVSEAKVLLHHTDWSVGDIAGSLALSTLPISTASSKSTPALRH